MASNVRQNPTPSPLAAAAAAPLAAPMVWLRRALPAFSPLSNTASHPSAHMQRRSTGRCAMSAPNAPGEKSQVRRTCPAPSMAAAR